MISALVLSLAIGGEFDFYAYGPYSDLVPRPETILGYGPGERHTTFRRQEQVMSAIAESARDRVRVFTYGESNEGRPLKIMVFGSPQNIARLEEIRAANWRVANGDVAPDDIPQDTPVVVWINECIHGNETASFESAMWLAYTLAASNSAQITKMLDDALIIVNPVYNPDGHERFVVWYNSVSIGHKDPQAFEHSEPRTGNGRTNHFRFDLNRDRVSISQAETQQAVVEYRRWNPQVYLDQHGQVGTYFFPPVAQSINTNVDRERYIELSEILGLKTADVFDAQGWRYFVRETFDLYYAGYLDSWASLNGAIGMTHETDGGRAIQRERGDGSVVTLRDGVAKHLASALAVIESSAENKTKFLSTFAKFRQDAATGKHAGKMKRVIATAADQRALDRYSRLLTRQGIVWRRVSTQFKQKATSYSDGKFKTLEVPAGSIIVDLAQPFGQLAKALLEPGQDFEDDFTARQLKIRDELKEEEKYPRRDRPEFYDSTGWSVPLAYGLEAYWASDTRDFVSGADPLSAQPVHHEGGKVGWVVPYTDQTDALVAIDLLQAGVRVHQSSKEMDVDGRKLPAGTFFIFRDRNDDGIDDKVNRALLKRVPRSFPLDTSFPEEGVVGPGSGSVRGIAKPNIAIVFGDQPDGTRFGSVWFAFDKQFRLPYTPISQSALSGDLDEFTCIVMPGGARVTDELKEWVKGGGSLVVLGGSAVLGKDGMVKLEESKLEDDKSPTSLPGTIFAVSLNARSPLAYGYDAGKPLAVPVSGSRYYKEKPEGGAVALLGEEPHPLSGWVWPDETLEALKGTVWLHDEPLGRGHVIWFAQDPTSRAMWPGTYKLLLNAVLLGRKQ